MGILDFSDYRLVIRHQLQISGNARGSHAKMAREIGVHSTTLSQILKGTKPLSLEQASDIADYFGFSELEADYFLLLVQYDRAGKQNLKAKLKKQLSRLRAQRNDLSLALPTNHKLSQKQQIIFYSSWKYSAIRVLSSIHSYQTIDTITDYLRLPRKEVAEKVKFLLECGLCIEHQGNLRPGPAYTHLEAASPLISKHHGNWRVFAMGKHENLKPSDLAFSSLMSISKKDASNIHSQLRDMIKSINHVREKSSCEDLRLLNLDWIEV